MLESLGVCFIQLLLIIDQCNTFRQIDTCWSSQVNYHIRSIDSNGTIREQTLNELEFVRECHQHFVQNLTNRSCSSSSSILHSPTSAQKYGYGFLAVFIVSILSLAGFLAFPLMKKPFYKYINAFFVALAVGTLYADAAFELFPVIVEFNARSTHNHEHSRFESNPKRTRIPLMLWQMTTLVLTSYVFFMIELAIHYIMHRFRPQNSDSFSHRPSPVTGVQLAAIESLPKDLPHGHGHAHSHAIVSSSVKSTGWMIIIADGIHNVADGLAIGAAFAESILFGVTTTIAIACHELPTELGEYMVLIESGFTFRRALLFNFISACTAIAGFFIGASIAENENARIWIFVITAGTFTYIALVDLWPTLMPEQPTFDWIRFICVTIGYLLGVSIMFILTIFEEDIVKRDNR